MNHFIVTRQHMALSGRMEQNFIPLSRTTLKSMGFHTSIGGMLDMRPLQISPETAVKLSEKLGVPLEHLMHMPQHILLQKIAELGKEHPGEDQADKKDDQ